MYEGILKQIYFKKFLAIEFFYQNLYPKIHL